jgi:hypothetical protein
VERPRRRLFAAAAGLHGVAQHRDRPVEAELGALVQRLAEDAGEGRLLDLRVLDDVGDVVVEELAAQRVAERRDGDQREKREQREPRASGGANVRIDAERSRSVEVPARGETLVRGLQNVLERPAAALVRCRPLPMDDPLNPSRN